MKLAPPPIAYDKVTCVSVLQQEAERLDGLLMKLAESKNPDAKLWRGLKKQKEEADARLGVLQDMFETGKLTDESYKSGVIRMHTAMQRLKTAQAATWINIMTEELRAQGIPQTSVQNTSIHLPRTHLAFDPPQVWKWRVVLSLPHRQHLHQHRQQLLLLRSQDQHPYQRRT